MAAAGARARRRPGHLPRSGLSVDQVCGVFNVGADDQNFRIRDLAQAVVDATPGTRAEIRDVRDPRSYRVRFERLRRGWGFRPEHSVADGVLEVAAYLRARAVDADDPRYHNVNSLSGRLGRSAS